MVTAIRRFPAHRFQPLRTNAEAIQSTDLRGYAADPQALSGLQRTFWQVIVAFRSGEPNLATVLLAELNLDEPSL